MPRLSNQVAIVTGGAWGIGGATARRLAEEGALVLIADLDDDAASVNVGRIRQSGGVAESVHTDVGRHKDIESMVKSALDLWGRVDILVNNAYSSPTDSNGSAIDVTEEGWDIAMSVMLKSVFLGAKYAVPSMRLAGGGSIVNISSGHGLLGSPGNMVYDTGKAAIIALTRQMATDFGPWGVRVNSITPGHILTERQSARMWENNPEGLHFFENQYPLRRCGQPVDIANAVAFLCSDDASFITGHNLAVDGGHTIQLQEDLCVQQAHYARQHPSVKLPY